MKVPGANRIYQKGDNGGRRKKEGVEGRGSEGRNGGGEGVRTGEEGMRRGLIGNDRGAQ